VAVGNSEERLPERPGNPVSEIFYQSNLLGNFFELESSGRATRRNKLNATFPFWTNRPIFLIPGRT